MEEKILNTRKNGMAMLLLTLLGYVASIALFIYSITLLNADRMLLGVPLLILSIAYWIAGIFLFCGLKVLKPQEALARKSTIVWVIRWRSALQSSGA